MDTGYKSDKFRGLLLGTAVGDSLGVPAEGLKPSTIEKLGWTEWKQRLVFGKGMVSDDTEHTLFVAQALICHQNNSLEFKQSLAWKLRWWLLGVPAGIGFGTLKAILKLWCFVPLARSGVKSAGNGPAMRSAVIGAYFYNDKAKLHEFVKCSTELTHTDPRALVGALAVAHAAAEAFECKTYIDKNGFLENLKYLGPEDPNWAAIVEQMQIALAESLSVHQFAHKLGLNEGVTGYIYHTVPVSIYSFLRHYGNFKVSLTEALNCGGDTDTVGAITGALAGAAVGQEGIPAEWISSIYEWPRGTSVLLKVADSLAENDCDTPVKYFWPGLILRNIAFTTVVLIHGLLRLVPAKMRKLMRINN